MYLYKKHSNERNIFIIKSLTLSFPAHIILESVSSRSCNRAGDDP